MNNPRTPEAIAAATAEQPPEDLSSLLNYPALGRLFDGATAASPELARMRTQLTQTVQQLERVQRQGSSTDAARAAQIVRAFQTTLKFLDELEGTAGK